MDKIMTFNLNAIEDLELTQEEFLSNGMSMAGTFDTLCELKEFLTSFAINYPEGVPLEYYHARLNSYRANKTLMAMLDQGLIREDGNDENGDILYILTDLGIQVTKLNKGK